MPRTTLVRSYHPRSSMLFFPSFLPSLLSSRRRQSVSPKCQHQRRHTGCSPGTSRPRPRPSWLDTSTRCAPLLLHELLQRAVAQNRTTLSTGNRFIHPSITPLFDSSAHTLLNSATFASSRQPTLPRPPLQDEGRRGRRGTTTASK